MPWLEAGFLHLGLPLGPSRPCGECHCLLWWQRGPSWGLAAGGRGHLKVQLLIRRMQSSESPTPTPSPCFLLDLRASLIWSLGQFSSLSSYFLPSFPLLHQFREINSYVGDKLPQVIARLTLSWQERSADL